MSPPKPVEHGSVTAKAAATAQSVALAPRRSKSRPILLARGSRHMRDDILLGSCAAEKRDDYHTINYLLHYCTTGSLNSCVNAIECTNA
jgi:hypothetical protein